MLKRYVYLWVVGLDTEWDVDLSAQRQGVPDRWKTAIMQIAYGNEVWIFQVSTVNLCKRLLQAQQGQVLSLATDIVFTYIAKFLKLIYSLYWVIYLKFITY